VTALDAMLLANTSIDSLTPKVKTAAFEMFAHESYNLRLAFGKLKTNGFKRGSIFPSHFNNSIGIVFVKIHQNSAS
jgi:hypothetical protein